jgi:hypothetical protein
MGRPSKFTPELAQEICDRLAKAEPLAVICRDDHMPSDRTVRNWMEGDAEFSSAIACARDLGFDALAAQCLDIADGRDKLTREDMDAQVANDVAVVRDHNRDRLRIETRLKLLAKWDPKRYGEKLAIGGDDGAGPIRHTVEWLPSE